MLLASCFFQICTVTFRRASFLLLSYHSYSCLLFVPCPMSRTRRTRLSCVFVCSLYIVRFCRASFSFLLFLIIITKNIYIRRRARNLDCVSSPKRLGIRTVRQATYGITLMSRMLVTKVNQRPNRGAWTGARGQSTCRHIRRRQRKASGQRRDNAPSAGINAKGQSRDNITSRHLQQSLRRTAFQVNHARCIRIVQSVPSIAEESLI